MPIDRRSFLAAAGTATVVSAAQAAPAIEAAQFGVRAGSPDDQSRALQRAIDEAAAKRAPLVIPSGVYRAASLNLPAGAQLIGWRGATKLVLSQASSLLASRGGENITLSGLVLDGGGIAAQGAALVQLTDATSLRIVDCEIQRAGGTALSLERCTGHITGNTIGDAGNVAIFSNDTRGGMLISGNTIARAGNNGICVWQSQKRDDGTQVIDNRIQDTAARSGGSGQNGNAINVYRAANVVVRGNRIKNAAFSAVRGNAASNIQILGNNCTGLGEVAIYAEFDFEGAIIADNAVDGAALGVAVTNFNKGGRLAVVRGNLIRNLTDKRPAGTDPGDSAGVGIGVEADTNVTGNVIENAPYAGIMVGEGEYQRDTAVTGNIVRNSGYGVTVSVSRAAGAVLVSNNLIAGSKREAIIGLDRKHATTGDLMADATPAGRHPHLTISGNRAR